MAFKWSGGITQGFRLPIYSGQYFDWWNPILSQTLRYAMFLRVSINKVNLLPERIMPGLIGVCCSETEVWFRESLISLPCTCFVHAAMKTAIELQTLSVSIFLSTHQGIAALTAPPCFSSLNPQISCEAHLSNIHMIMISKLVTTEG